MNDTTSIGLLSAFGAGILSFLSPCVLPLVPGYLSYISGISVEQLTERPNPREVIPVILWNGSWFGLGFTTVFVIMGATATLMGQSLMQNSIWLTRVGGLITFALGLHMTHAIRIPWLDRVVAFQGVRETAGPLSAFILGATFSLGWTPCIGPILTGILTLASQQQHVREGMALLAVYSVGLAIPFTLAGLLLGSFLGWYRGFRHHLPKVELVSGILLMVIGILLMTNRLGVLAQKLQVLWG